MTEEDEEGDPLFLFAHIPKTGGQTLRNHFRRHLKFHEQFIHLGPFGNKDTARLGLPPFFDRPLELRQKALVIQGHDVNIITHRLVPGRTPRYAVFVRDPAERVVSQYNFDCHFRSGKKAAGDPSSPDEAIPSFEDWYKDRAQNNMSGHIAHMVLQLPRNLPKEELNERLQQGLEQFWFVGLTETLDADAPRLCRAMGLPDRIERANVAGVNYPKRLQVTDALRDLIYQTNPYDLELYRRCQASAGRYLEKLPP